MFYLACRPPGPLFPPPPLQVGQGGPGNIGPTPLTVAPNWLVEAGAGVDEMDAAVRPAKTTSMAKMRTINFILLVPFRL